MPIINTLADLEALKGTPEYDEALDIIRGSMTAKMNVAEYPEGYGLPDYKGPKVEPIWETQENSETLDLLGFVGYDHAEKKEAFLATLAPAKAAAIEAAIAADLEK